MTPPTALPWLEPDREVPWRLADLARNLLDIRAALAESREPDQARRLRDAEAWHVQLLAAHAYRQGLDEFLGPREAAELLGGPAQTPASSTPARWLDATAEDEPCR